jgi:hypothetical protein
MATPIDSLHGDEANPILHKPLASPAFSLGSAMRRAHDSDAP